MFDFARRAQLAVGDTARRAALKAAAAVVGLVAGGFLTAALWSFLATELGWGSAMASLVIGGALLAITVILVAVSARKKHRMPTTEDLKNEVQARVSLATEAAVLRARSEATRMVELAETKATSLMDQAGNRASKLASDAEDKLFGSVRKTASAVGLTSANLHAAEHAVKSGSRQVREASDSNAGSMAKLIGAFAVGVTLAAAIKESRSRDPYDPDDLM